MPVFKGITSDVANSDVFNIPCTIESFSLYNVSGGDAEIDIHIINEDGIPDIIVYHIILTDKENALISIPILLLPKSYIKIITTDIINYYFSIV